MARLWDALDHIQKVRANLTQGPFGLLKLLQLSSIGQLPFKQQIGHLFKAAVLGQILHRIAAVDERVDLRHHLGNCGGVDDDSFESFFDIDGFRHSLAPC